MIARPPQNVDHRAIRFMRPLVVSTLDQGKEGFAVSGEAPVG